MQNDKKLPATLLMKAALPQTKVLLEEKPALARKYRKWNRVIQFQVKDDPDLACHLAFEKGNLEFVEGRHRSPHVDFIFKDAGDFVNLMAGKPALPKIKGALRHPRTLVGFLPLMLGLTILLPSNIPKTPKKRALKVKLMLYFVSLALSKLNQAGDEEMVNFTKGMPDRIFQWSVDGGGLAVYLRVKRGKTKAGKGHYTKKRPFVHMRFASTESAFQILTGQVDNVTAIKDGMLVVEGSPEHGKDITSIMRRIESMIA